MNGAPALHRTPLYDLHRQAGARWVHFAGWELPLEFSGILDEHRAVREAAGLFDVSHMGEIEIRGPEAFELVNEITVNDVRRLYPGKAQYSALIYEHGGFVDDLVVHMVAQDWFFLCVNAANQHKDYQHILRYNRRRATVELTSDRYVQLALQGPRAQEILQRLTSVDLAGLRPFHFVDTEVANVAARVARTGYTGEDGFEIYVDPAQGPQLWTILLEIGRDYGLKPCGLGARNNLRLEAGLPLYGHEIDASTSPFEAGLGWLVKFDKGDFIGRRALEQAQQRVSRRLVGFELHSRAIAREGYEVLVDGRPAGWVTSGTFSPVLDKSIGLCYLPWDKAQPGQAIRVLIRGRLVDGVVVATPFYRARR